MTTSALFREALDFTLKMEGDWYPGDEARDTNPTMKGVTQETYDKYRNQMGMVNRSVINISGAELEYIYLRGYWNPIAPTAVVHPLCLAVFDMAVNAGPSRAIKILQGLVGSKADGILGPKTNNKVWGWSGSSMKLFSLYQTERLAFYGGLALRNMRLRPNLIAWTHRVVMLSRKVYNDEAGE